MVQPEFPLTVRFFEDDTTIVLNSKAEVECNLEWFDSNDSEQHAEVRDARNRPVRLVVRDLSLITLELQS
jgi:hypothetical protein